MLPVPANDVLTPINETTGEVPKYILWDSWGSLIHSIFLTYQLFQCGSYCGSNDDEGEKDRGGEESQHLLSFHGPKHCSKHFM